MKRIVISGLILLLACGAVGSGQTSKVTWFAVDMGYAELSTDNSTLKAVVGQPFVGVVKLSNTQIISGFLADTLFSHTVLGIGNEEQLPGTFALLQNYPNPFNPSTTVRYELPGASDVTLSVFDMLGRQVAVLVNERREAGMHEVRLEGRGLSSGVYFYRLHARPLQPATGGGGDFTQTRKLILLK